MCCFLVGAVWDLVAINLWLYVHIRSLHSSEHFWLRCSRDLTPRRSKPLRRPVHEDWRSSALFHHRFGPGWFIRIDLHGVDFVACISRRSLAYALNLPSSRHVLLNAWLLCHILEESVDHQEGVTRLLHLQRWLKFTHEFLLLELSEILGHMLFFLGILALANTWWLTHSRLVQASGPSCFHL